MPSPIGHSLAALALDRAFLRELSTAEVLLLSVLPDIDLVPAVLGQENDEIEHGHATHSLTAAVLAGLTAAAFRTSPRSRTRALVEASLVYGSHLFLDALGKEQEDGLPLLWPFTGRRWTFGPTLFRTIRRKPDQPFLAGLINRPNSRAVAKEMLVLLPVLLIAIAFFRADE
jgi:membrane-bound metal-dependent hydrolase YbcI (DUF457 family)